MNRYALIGVLMAMFFSTPVFSQEPEKSRGDHKRRWDANCGCAVRRWKWKGVKQNWISSEKCENLNWSSARSNSDASENHTNIQPASGIAESM